MKPKNHASDFGKKPDFLNSKICKNLNALDTRLHITCHIGCQTKNAWLSKLGIFAYFYGLSGWAAASKTNPIGFTTCQLFVCTNDILLFTISISTADPHWTCDHNLPIQLKHDLIYYVSIFPRLFLP